MSTGISISSINRIKELAEEKKYAEALEILDTQNLDKSINPQFLRISGEIFRENKRYYDSRRILLKAHQMSPQGNRIIFELIQLYLELGYFTKAQKYYEQYLFYSTPEDTQKDYVEYIMKKALGSDVKELASILIPILEQMPEDRWNFEAVLLYDKIERKDKALDESRYILENFKESIYVQPVIDYIDDKLDVDKYFYIYPKEEQQEDTELFGDLIEQEEKLLEADYLRMYPPEARIMVEAEDKDAIESKPIKEKKVKKRNKKAKDTESIETENIQSDTQEHISEENILKDDFVSGGKSVQDVIKEAEQLMNPEQAEIVLQKEQETLSIEERQIKEEREAALEKLLSKRIDTDKIKESAKQVAKAVKDIDTAKAKSQVKSVAESVKDNVRKATDVLGEAVGTKQTVDNLNQEITQSDTSEDEQIVDGIIESVLEPPKKVVGQVVMNEELDALIPDSLEAMSEEEIADIEARREEEERLELEALEAALQMEEKKKSKGRQNKEEGANDISDSENEQENMEQDSRNGSVSETESTHTDFNSSVGESFAELKERFLANLDKEEEQPLDSLGFISVVHSDVDETMEEEIPDAAGMLRQMIDNKEFYAGENSTGFESRSSYQDHGFEVEDYDFETFRTFNINEPDEDDVAGGDKDTQLPVVEVIYAQEKVVDFDEIIPQDQEILPGDEPSEESGCETVVDFIEQVTVEQKGSDTTSNEELQPVLEEEISVKEPVEVFQEDIKTEESDIVSSEEPFAREVIGNEEEEILVLEGVCVSDDETVAGEAEEAVNEILLEKPVLLEESEKVLRREELRVKILLSDSMVRMLLDLKESR